jgi:hypothetical protein
MQDVWLAADLAVFHILLAHSGGGVNCGFVPFPTSGTLKACGHGRFPMVTAKSSGQPVKG